MAHPLVKMPSSVRAPMWALFLLSAFHLQPARGLTDGDIRAPAGYSCPSGWLPTLALDGIAYNCLADPCYGGGTCGPSNTCNPVPHISRGPVELWVSGCTCNPPYELAIEPVYYTIFSNPQFTLTLYNYTTCYLPGGSDPCASNPCQNGGTCYNQYGEGGIDGQGAPIPKSTAVSYTCVCPNGFSGPQCNLQGNPPRVSVTVNGFTGLLAKYSQTPATCADDPAHHIGCLYEDGAHYLCCDDQGCGPIGPDGNTPLCRESLSVPSPNTFPPPGYQQQGPPTSANDPPPNPPSGSQGVCGSGPATDFPTRCWFNSDPLARYVCCDQQGCNGFNSDNLTPHCANNGYVPANFGLASAAPPTSSPPSGAPATGDQGVCGTGAASGYPNRCWFNSDPEGRYVCCDSQGCDGFNPPDYKFPHCKNYGYVPPGYGQGSANPPANPPPSNPSGGSQGVCGSGAAVDFPTRCWFNSDPLGRYVCCDQQGCNGFNNDNLTPHCANNGFVPPNYGL